MKRLFTTLSLWLGALSCFAAQTVNVTIALTDFGLNPITNRTVWIQSMSAPTVSSSSVVIGDRYVTNSGTTGVFTISNMLYGLYVCTVLAPPQQTVFKILLTTNDTGTINAYNNLVADSTATFPAGTVAWSAAVTDARYARATGSLNLAIYQYGSQNLTNWSALATNLLIGVKAGTNITTVTNGQEVAVSLIAAPSFNGANVTNLNATNVTGSINISNTFGNLNISNTFGKVNLTNTYGAINGATAIYGNILEPQVTNAIFGGGGTFTQPIYYVSGSGIISFGNQGTPGQFGGYIAADGSAAFNGVSLTGAGTSFTGKGNGLTALNASQLTSGTVPSGVFPATLPAASGVNLTALNATQLTSGTVPIARLSGITSNQVDSGTDAAYRATDSAGVQAVGDVRYIKSNSGKGTNTTLVATATADTIVATNFTGNGVGLTNLNATNLIFGTLPTSNFVLVAGANTTITTNVAARSYTIASSASTGSYVSNNNGFATNLTLVNTTTADKIVATNFTGNGTGITNLPASATVSGVFNSARLGSGTADSTKWLRGDSTWATVIPTGDWLLAGNSGISAANFLGTIDSHALYFKANSVLLGSLDTSNNVTFGSANTIIDGSNPVSDYNANVISGGSHNTITNTQSGADTIAGGNQNAIGSSGSDNTISGGSGNVITNATSMATIAGGVGNSINGLASDFGAFISGGISNYTSGSNTWAGGKQAMATNAGAYVWADSAGGPFGSTNANSYNVRAAGGVRFVTGGAGITIDNLPFVSSGTISDARLSANVPLLSAQNTFTASNNIPGAFIGDGSRLTNLPSSNVVSTFLYTNTNISFANPSNGLGSLVFNVSGAAGVHTNSNNIGIDFAAANGQYVWSDTTPGLNWYPPYGREQGVFTNTLNNGWQMGYVFSGVAEGLGGSFGGWTIYRTNGALQFVDGTTHNAVLWGYNGSIWLPDMQTPNWWSYQPDGATSNVRVIPSYVTNTYAVTVDTRSALPSLLKPPSIGGTKSWLIRGNAPIPGQPAGYRGLLSLTNGAGVVREIKINVSGLGGWNGFHTNIWLQLFPDCGVLSNTVAPSFSAPLSVLASDYYTLNQPSWSYDTRYVSVAQHSGSGAISPSGNIAALLMVLKTPCRFTNGFYAALTNKTAGAELTGADTIFTTVNYSMDEVGFLASDPYKDWRLRSAFTRGAFGPPSGYATNDWTKTTPTILNTQKPGVLLGLWVSVGLTGNGLAFENSFHIYTDGNLTPWQGDGEDTPLNPWEFENGGNIMGLDFGTPNYLYGQYVEWYRQYDTGNVYWNHDALGVFPTIQGNPVTDNKDILLIYYGP